MTLSQVHARLLFNGYYNVTWLGALMLMLIKCMKRQRVGFGRKVGTLVLVHVRIWMCHYLLRIRYTMHNDAISIARSPTIAMSNNSARWCWCRFNVWNGIVLALNEQEVRWYWCTFEFECAITWYTMHHEWYDHNLLHSYLLFNYNGDNMTYIRLCADVDVVWIYWTVSCWLWTYSLYVGIGACLDLNV